MLNWSGYGDSLDHAELLSHVATQASKRFCTLEELEDAFKGGKALDNLLWRMAKTIRPNRDPTKTDILKHYPCNSLTCECELTEDGDDNDVALGIRHAGLFWRGAIFDKIKKKKKKMVSGEDCYMALAIAASEEHIAAVRDVRQASGIVDVSGDQIIRAALGAQSRPSRSASDEAREVERLRVHGLLRKMWEMQGAKNAVGARTARNWDETTVRRQIADNKGIKPCKIIKLRDSTKTERPHAFSWTEVAGSTLTTSLTIDTQGRKLITNGTTPSGSSKVLAQATPKPCHC
ncbi:hypothetical protein LTR56_004561 [Elasticomyces elasticus]|nr:hypothetical protein LTR56_004561 [Elasticomyces elasticus]KAK4925900.1 hypothetical protein LTR49_007038 [Elasticomyces elasticus]KAK5768137.1 hypothetical protein LTS12_001621 [Elasticomyces elasticus]